MKKSLTVMFLATMASIFTLTAYAAKPNTVGPSSTTNSSAPGFMTAVDLVNDSTSGITLHNNGVSSSTLTGIFIQTASLNIDCTQNTLFDAPNNGYGVLWTNVTVAAGIPNAVIGANYLYNVLNLALTYAAFPSNIGSEPRTPGNNVIAGTQWCVQLGLTNAATQAPGTINSLIDTTSTANSIPIYCYDPTSTMPGYCIGEDTQSFTP